MLGTIIEVTAVLIALYLVLSTGTNAKPFETVAGAIGKLFSDSVGALQGPKKNG